MWFTEISLVCFVEGIHSRDIVAILHLLVALARRFDCKKQLTPGVKINIVTVQVCHSMFQCFILFAHQAAWDIASDFPIYSKPNLQNYNVVYTVPN